MAHLIPNVLWVVFHMVLLQKRDVFLLERSLLMVLCCFAMYSVTSNTLDSLTLNTPYPVCHAKFRVCLSRIHRDELVFTTRAISAAECAGRTRINI